MVIDPPAPKPDTSALVFVPVPSASIPLTLPAPASVTLMVSLVEPSTEAVLPVPPDVAMMPATPDPPALTTVMLSLSPRVAVASLVVLSTSMALIAGSMVTLFPRVTLVMPLAALTMPLDPAVMVASSSTMTDTKPAPVEPTSMPVVPAVMSLVAVTTTEPLSKLSVILAWMPVPNGLVPPIRPAVTETPFAVVVAIEPLAMAWMPKPAPPPDEVMSPVVSTEMNLPPVFRALMPVAPAPETAMLSRNTEPPWPTMTAPLAASASTPRVTAVMALAEPPVCTLTWVPRELPTVVAWMPTPPDFTAPSAVTVTLPMSLDMASARMPAVEGVLPTPRPMSPWASTVMSPEPEPWPCARMP